MKSQPFRVRLSLYGRKDRLHEVTIEFAEDVLDGAEPGRIFEAHIVEVQRIQVTR